MNFTFKIVVILKKSVIELFLAKRDFLYSPNLNSQNAQIKVIKVMRQHVPYFAFGQNVLNFTFHQNVVTLKKK